MLLSELKGEEKVESLFPFLKDKDCEIRKITQYMLSEIRDTAEIEALWKLYLDGDLSQRKEIIRILAKTRKKETVRYLMKAVKEKDKEIRFWGIWGLARTTPEKILLCVNLLKNETSKRVKLEFIRGISKIKKLDERVREILKNAIKDTEWEIRFEALKIVDRLETEEKEKFLKHAAEDENYFVKERAKWLLEKEKSLAQN